MMRGSEHLTHGKRLGEDLTTVFKYVESGVKKMEPGTSQPCPGPAMGTKQEIPFKREEASLSCKGGETLHEVTQTGYEVSVLGDI